MLLKKACIFMNQWVIGKSSIKDHYQKKKEFRKNVNMEDITDSDYNRSKKMCKDFEVKSLNEYHDLDVKSEALLLAVFESFRKCLQTYELDPAKFLSAPLKRTKVKLDPLTDIDLLLMVEKGIRGGLYHSINGYAKANNRYMKIMIKIKNLHIFNIEM